MSRSPAKSGKAIATKSSKEKWLIIVQSAREKGENEIKGFSTITCRGGMAREGRRRWLTREGLIKFLVAPQSMRAVVVTVLALYRSLIGNRKAHLDLLATITEAVSREEEDVTSSSCVKKTAPWFRWYLPQSVRGVTTQ